MIDIWQWISLIALHALKTLITLPPKRRIIFNQLNEFERGKIKGKIKRLPKGLNFVSRNFVRLQDKNSLEDQFNIGSDLWAYWRRGETREIQFCLELEADLS